MISITLVTRNERTFFEPVVQLFNLHLGLPAIGSSQLARQRVTAVCLHSMTELPAFH